MVTNHWVSSSSDTGWVPGATFTTRNIAVPAGATMKRFVVRAHVIQGTTNGANLGAVGNFYCTQDVTIVSGDYATRNLYHQDVAIEAQLAGLYDVASGARIYSQLLNCGDERFLIDQRCSYGKRDGAGFTVRYTGAIFVGPGFTGLLSNSHATAEFRVLYETLP